MPSTFAQMPRTIPADILAEKVCGPSLPPLMDQPPHLAQTGPTHPTSNYLSTCFCRQQFRRKSSSMVQGPGWAQPQYVSQLQMQLHSNIYINSIYYIRHVYTAMHSFQGFFCHHSARTFDHSHLTWVSSDIYSYATSHPPCEQQAASPSCPLLRDPLSASASHLLPSHVYSSVLSTYSHPLPPMKKWEKLGTFSNVDDEWEWEVSTPDEMGDKQKLLPQVGRQRSFQPSGRNQLPLTSWHHHHSA